MNEVTFEHLPPTYKVSDMLYMMSDQLLILEYDESSVKHERLKNGEIKWQKSMYLVTGDNLSAGTTVTREMLSDHSPTETTGNIVVNLITVNDEKISKEFVNIEEAYNWVEWFCNAL